MTKHEDKTSAAEHRAEVRAEKEAAALKPAVIVQQTDKPTKHFLVTTDGALPDREVVAVDESEAIRLYSTDGNGVQVDTCKYRFKVTELHPPATPPAKPIASVTVDQDTASLAPQKTAQIAIKFQDQDGKDIAGRCVSWASSNASVATVSQEGLVTAVAAGTATVTATCEGKTGSARVTVTDPPA